MTTLHKLTLMLLSCACVSTASAITNGSFESGLTGWSAAGDVSVQAGIFPTSTAEGTFKALLTTASVNSQDDFPLSAGAFNLSGTAAVEVGSASGLETFLNVPIGSLDPDPSNFIFATEGSAIKQSFNVTAGDVLHFNWNFLTNEQTAVPKSDYAFVLINNSLIRLAGPADAGAVSSPFLQQTGYQSFSYTFASAGNVQLAFGVVDGDDFDTTSALAIDNVTVAAVPEPQIYSMLLGGLALIGLAARRR